MKKRLDNAIAIAISLAALLTGCESADDSSGSYWNTKSVAQPATSATGTATTQSATASATDVAADAVDGAGDEVSFSSLSWDFGGVNGARAAKTSASITGLSVRGSSLSYRWAGDTLRSWGIADGKADALACLFVQRSDGKWVGGKFDWISTSRTSRNLENIFKHYHGWSLSGVPNPCPCAFVIMSADGKKRTNVISGTWQR